MCQCKGAQLFERRSITLEGGPARGGGERVARLGQRAGVLRPLQARPCSALPQRAHPARLLTNRGAFGDAGASSEYLSEREHQRRHRIVLGAWPSQAARSLALKYASGTFKCELADALRSPTNGNDATHRSACSRPWSTRSVTPHPAPGIKQADRAKPGADHHRTPPASCTADDEQLSAAVTATALGPLWSDPSGCPKCEGWRYACLAIRRPWT